MRTRVKRYDKRRSDEDSVTRGWKVKKNSATKAATTRSVKRSARREGHMGFAAERFPEDTRRGTREIVAETEISRDKKFVVLRRRVDGKSRLVPAVMYFTAHSSEVVRPEYLFYYMGSRSENPISFEDTGTGLRGAMTFINRTELSE